MSLPAAALAGGAFSVTPGSALGDGGYTALVEQRDGTGNVGRSASRPFTIDTQAPSPALTAPAAGSTTSDTTPLFSGTAGTATGDAATVGVQVWQGSNTSVAPVLALSATRNSGGAFSVESPTALTDGLYTVRAQQADAAGNLGSSATRTFTVATSTPPPAPVTITPVADSYVDASLPSTNYGTAKLRTDGSPVVRSYLRFDVQGWVPGTSRATLRLYPTSNLNTGLQVVRVADTTWGERTITSANAPPVGSLVATTTPPKANLPVSVDVTAAVTGNGAMSLALVSPDSTAEALASRESGASSPQLVVDHPDLTPPAPVLDAPADGSLLTTATPSFSGTGGTAPGDAATVSVVIWADTDTDETPLVSLPAAMLGGGVFSVTADPPLLDGTYTVLVEQHDGAGNTGRSAERTITIDTAAPTPVLNAPADGAATADATPTFSGAAGAGAGDAPNVSVLVWQGSDTSGDPRATLNTTRGGAGAFSVDSPAALTDGLYSVRVQQGDTAGHTGSSPVTTFTMDTGAPTPALTSPADGSTTTDVSPSFGGTAGTAAGDSATVAISIWDGTTASGTPVVSFDATADGTTGAYAAAPAAPLDGGTYTARAQQSDAAGNRGASAATTFTVNAPDATAPKPALTTPADGSATNDSTPSFAGNAGTRPGDGDTVRVLAWSGADTGTAPVVDVNATRAGDGSFSADAPNVLTDGGYTARVEQDDAATNHGASGPTTFTVDTDDPNPVLTHPADGSETNDAKPTFDGVAGTAGGDANSVSVLVWTGSSATGNPAFTVNTPRAADGAFSAVPPTALEEGAHTARVEQTDAAGNRGVSAAHTFTYTGAPDPTIAAAGDIACGSTSTATACKQMATSDLILGANPAAVLALGDTQYESGVYADYLSRFDPSWGRFKPKIYPAIGNHEYGSSLNGTCDVNITGDPRSYACGYFDYFDGKGNLDGRAGERGKGYYAFDVGRWRLYSLNSNCDRTGGGTPSCALGGAQEQWLRADLAAHPAQCQLMYMHHPMFTSDTRQFDTAGFRDLLRPLWNAFYDYGGDLVLTGHSHFYERYLPQTPLGVADAGHGIQQFIVGTGGRNIYNVDANGIEPTSVVRNSTSFGVLQVTLHSTSYDWRFVPTAGSTFTDAGTRDCHGAP
jgi:hypothetical protein